MFYLFILADIQKVAVLNHCGPKVNFLGGRSYSMWVSNLMKRYTTCQLAVQFESIVPRVPQNDLFLVMRNQVERH